jgi:DUF1365 family protein
VNYHFFNLAEPEKLPTVPFIFDFKSKNYLNPLQISEIVKSKLGASAEASIKEIYLLTQLSYFGFCFNPVSFYYCYGESEELLYIISQITNTPWKEKHIDCFEFQNSNSEIRFLKEFHVSPFMPMEIDYSWKFNRPEESIKILMKSQHQNEERTFFFAQMDLRSKELNAINNLISFFTYPLMSFKTITGIYWQALLLYLKKVPFHTHPKKREVM